MQADHLNQKKYQLFNSKIREVIRILFDARNEDIPAHRVYEDERIAPESLDLLRMLNLLNEEEGYMSLDADLIEFLERAFNIAEVVSTGRIAQCSDDAQKLYNIYDTLDSDSARRNAARRIRKYTETIISDLRSTQRDIRRRISQEFRFETSLNLKIQQLEAYQDKAEDFLQAVGLCQQRHQDTESYRASANPLLRLTRKRLQKQLNMAMRAQATIAHEILDYIHRAREDKTYLNKLARVSDLIDRQEYQSQTNLNDILESGVLARLSRAEPLRTLLPADLNGNEHQMSIRAEKAEKLGLSSGHEEAPTIEENPKEAEAIHIPDIPGILKAFKGHHRGRDLFSFLFEEKTGYPEDELLESRLIETFCLILSSDYSADLYASPTSGLSEETERAYRYLRVFAEQVEDSTPRNQHRSLILETI